MADGQLYPKFQNNTLATTPMHGEILPRRRRIREPRTFREAAESYIIRKPYQRRVLQKVIERIGDEYLDDIAPIEILDLAVELYPTQKNATRNRNVITPVKAVYYHGANHRWCEPIRIRNLKEDPPPRVEPASAEWIHLFLRQADLDGLPHIGSIVLFMFTTGARVSEALRLQWDDVDLLNRTAILRRTKTEVNSLRYITNQMAKRLEDLRKSAPTGKPVFRIINRSDVNDRLKAIALRAGIKPKTSHRCGRHGMASMAIAIGADIKSTMLAGGWKSVPIFLRYVNPKSAGRSVADRFNLHQFDGDI